MRLSDLVGTALPTGNIRCDNCLKTHKPQDDSHLLMGIIPNLQFCPTAGKFATWTELAIPRNFIKIDLERV